MATGRFKVTLTGQFDRARGRDDIRAALVELFKLSESEVDRLLDSAPVTIKSDLDYDTASRYKLAIEQTGALCEVREVDDHELRAAPTPAASTTLADVSPPSAPPPPPDTRASGGSTIGSVSPRRVEAGRGAAWWREGWALFMAAPGGWFAIGILMMLIMLVLEIIPVLGFIASLLLPPLLTGGVMFAAHEQHAGRPLSVGYLFTGFSRRTGPLLALGGIYFGASVLIFAVVGALLAGAMAGSGAGFGAGMEDMMRMGEVMVSATGLVALFIGTTASLVLVAAMWFAPALVMLREMSPVEALRASLLASLRNWLPMLVYGLLMLVFAIVAMLPMMLGYLLLVPLVMTSVYVSYRDIFEA